MSTGSSPLRLLIAGGGTGGHVIPALAVLDELQDRGIEMDVLWVGSDDGVEARFTRERGIPFRQIQTGKLRRYFSWENFVDGLRLPVGTVQAWSIVRGFKPDVVFSTGGNISVPTVIASKWRAPILTHEQTAQVGMANKISARMVTRFACSYEQTAVIARTMHKDVVVTGNPVRKTLTSGDKARGLERFGFSDSLPVLFVTGGARGASAINERIEAMLPDILEITQIIHQTGPIDANPDFPRLSALQASLPDSVRSRYQVREMITDEMADIYAMASLVIGRSGAGTVAELAYLGLPAILIPLDGTGGDEQWKNARLLADAEAAVVVAQKETSAETLESTLRALLENGERLTTMSTNARALGRGDAAANVADHILDLAGR
ncbi:MAG: undecaprenyldiphospho-muramoylpentapeptide beta-N-acetylglucosaminyltransferase [Thermomicrobiales bacterium]|nr:undecaprenyldiphospho-muramoylpentapeptide beta-N-acetylglucosaminyltransferase [Thermomicrobiales bacterium]